MLGLACYLAGDGLAARAVWEDCRERRPEDPRVEAYLAMLARNDSAAQVPAGATADADPPPPPPPPPSRDGGRAPPPGAPGPRARSPPGPPATPPRPTTPPRGTARPRGAPTRTHARRTRAAPS